MYPDFEFPKAFLVTNGNEAFENNKSGYSRPPVLTLLTQQRLRTEKLWGRDCRREELLLLFFQFRFLTHSVDVIRLQDHLEKPKQIAHSLLNSFVYYVYSRPAETDLT